MAKEIIKKVMSKMEFSQLPLIDVELALSHFEDEASDEEKIRLTREMLNKVFWGFRSQKLLSPKNKDEMWILRKHLSTRERAPYYKEVYERIFSEFKRASIIDLGAGVNGFSYQCFPIRVDYGGIEAVGQLVDLTNNYFKKNKIYGKVYHFSLFELKKVKEIIKKTKKPRIVFLFKVLDSLELLKRDYSKGFLEEITPLADRMVISFATRSMIAKKPFRVSRKWLLEFISQRFKILDDFEIGEERYIIFGK